MTRVTFSAVVATSHKILFFMAARKRQSTSTKKPSTKRKPLPIMPASASEDVYGISLWDLAFNRSRAAPTDEAAPFMDGQQEEAPAAEGYQPSAYELRVKENIRRNREYMASIGLEPLSAVAGNKKRPPVTKKRPATESGRKESRKKVVEKRPRSSRLKEVDKSRQLNEEDETRGSVVLQPNIAMRISFCHFLNQIDKVHPDADDSGKRGRFKLAQRFAGAIKQYILDGCPLLEGDDKWDYVLDTLTEQEATTKSAGSSPVHRLMHLPKKTKFAGAHIVPSKSEYPQFTCREGCKKRVRAYCSCSPGIIICNECFARHTIEKEAEAASDFYANEGDRDDESEST